MAYLDIHNLKQNKYNIHCFIKPYETNTKNILYI